MSDWEIHSQAMDAKVDELLGDTISLSTNGGASYTTVGGFILLVVGSSGIDGFDETLGYKPRAKLHKSLIGEEPPNRDTVRIRAGKLGGLTYQPAGGEPDDQGRYWLFDIQKMGRNPNAARTSSTRVGWGSTGTTWDSDTE